MVREMLMDFIWPKVCVGCGKWETFLCTDCRKKPDIAQQICPMCGEDSPMGWTHGRCIKKYGMDGLITLYDYQEPVMKALVDEVKYRFNRELIKILLKNFVFESGVTFDFLVPVPLYYYRENWRGFNQAELIARELESKMKIPMGKLILRTRNTKQQAVLKTRKEREENIKGAFEVSKEYLQGDSLKGKNILLVDDVFTSGADMRECTKILKKAGVDTVWGLALAH